jgi:glycosyltransferase involved in cell wall biosynthesis
LSESSHADPTLISVVVPLYNEEENVRPLVERLDSVFKQIGCRWELVFALDPSPDRTRERILELMDGGFPIRLITFSRRIGKPLSLLAGLDHARGDACVIIDADLQDPPELIVEMVEKWRQGFKVVIAQRFSRRGESYFYLKCAQLFYWLVERISEVRIPPNTGDFRLLDARVVKEIRSFRERHAFLRGVTAAAGFSTPVIPFDRDPRFAGKTQISFMGAVNIALDGIIPFSRTPLRVMFVLGLFYVLLAKATGIAWLVYSIVAGFSTNWPIIVLCILLVGMTGLIVACLGVLGEYLVRAYEEARNRPLYIVDEIRESKVLSSEPSHGGNRCVDHTER